MATSITSILASLRQLVSEAHLLDPAHWSGWITGDGPKRDVTVAGVLISEQGLDLSVVDAGTTHKLRADLQGVHFDGVEIPGASVVFGYKGGLAHLARVSFDFRPIPLNGNVARFNMRFTA